jgi:cell division septation protein DedD
VTGTWIALTAASLAMLPLRAQTADSAATMTTGDSVVDRALHLAHAGGTQGDKGRALLDSVLRATPPDDSQYSNALYWRSALATTARDSIRYYNRLLIEAPLSPRVEDALVGLAGVEEAQGDRAAAAQHLTRFMLSYANSPQRARVSAWLVRLLFEDSQLARSCAALVWARDAIPAGNVELRNRVEYYAPRCANLPPDSVVSPDTASTPPAPAPPATRAVPTPARPVPPPPPQSRGTAGQTTFYSVQVAAYEVRAPAERMAKSLVARGIDARVDGTEQPFRVRVGKYSSHADAVKAAAALKAKGITGFLTAVTAPRQ